jgi:hypothetical protein
MLACPGLHYFAPMGQVTARILFSSNGQSHDYPREVLENSHGLLPRLLMYSPCLRTSEMNKSS